MSYGSDPMQEQSVSSTEIPGSAQPVPEATT